MVEINILTNYDTAFRFRQIKEFKLDLGKSFVNRKTERMEINDNFIGFQLDKYNRLVYKIGSLGKVNFYYETRIPRDEVEIYYDTEKYVEVLNQPNIKTWFAETLFAIEKRRKGETDTDTNTNTNTKAESGTRPKRKYTKRSGSKKSTSA
jgi:hypothetical protein